MKQTQDPAPALTRGVALVRQLSVEGQGTLEQLARRAGWPKSSTLRYLQALELAGVVRQDAVSKVWHLRERLVSFEAERDEVLERWRGRLGGLAQETGHCVELYRVISGGLELRDRADPVVEGMQLSARIGFRRDLSECDATGLLYYAFAGVELGKTALSWRWSAGDKVRVNAAARRAGLAAARSTGMAVDAEFNGNGIRRFGVAVRDERGSLAGVLAVAQRLTPLAERQTAGILATMKIVGMEAAASGAANGKQA